MNKTSSRVQDQLAYVLHSTAWRETSALVHIFSREIGHVLLVAKGAKGPYSLLRPILSTFQPLLLSWSGKGEIKTLTGAEVIKIRALTGNMLMSGWYMNELILRLLAREDAHPKLFDAYDRALEQLTQGDHIEALRRFEWILLQEIGYGIDCPLPNFSDLESEPTLRRSLQDRINQQLAGQPLKTRRVLIEWRQMQKQV